MPPPFISGPSRPSRAGTSPPPRPPGPARRPCYPSSAGQGPSPAAACSRTSSAFLRSPDAKRRRRCRRRLHGAAEGGDEDGFLARGVGREERDHVTVVEGEAGGSEALCVGREIEAAPEEAGLEIGQAIPAIAIRLEERVEIGEEEDGRARHAAEGLLEAEIGRLLTEVTPLQELEGMRGRV